MALDHAYDLFADIGADIANVHDGWRPSLATLDKVLSQLSAARAMLAALESNALPLPLDSDLANALEMFSRDCAQDLQDHREALLDARDGIPDANPYWPAVHREERCTVDEAVETIRASIDRDLDDLTGSRSILGRANAFSA